MHHNISVPAIYFGDMKRGQMKWFIGLDDCLAIPGDKITFHEYVSGEGKTGETLNATVLHCARLTEIDLDDCVGFGFELDF